MKKTFWLVLLGMSFAAPRTAGAAAPVISANGVVNNGSFAPGANPLAPGTLAAIFGTNLNDGSQNPFSSFANGKLVTTLGGASVTFNGFPAPMFSSFPGQLNVQVPFEVAGSNSASVVVTVAGQQSAPVMVPIGPSSPGIFTINNFGQGAVLIANTGIFVASTGSISGAQSRPAQPGDFITIFATGLGAVSNPPATGAAGSGQSTIATPQVTIEGIPAPFSFSGLAPSFVALNQVNVQVPTGVSANNSAGLVMSIGGVQSNTVTIAVGGNGGGPQSFCQGFSLQGTATSLTGTIPGVCLFPPGAAGIINTADQPISDQPSRVGPASAITGGVNVSLTGAVSGNQTIYSGNVTGSGMGQCATGSTGAWTASFGLTVTVNPTVASLATNGGILSGSQRIASGTLNFCGSTQILNSIQAFGVITGSVNAGGAATVNIGGPNGLPPVVLRGNANGVNGPLSGTVVTLLLAGNTSGGSTLALSTTGTSANGQTVFSGIGSGTGTAACPNGAGTWTATASSFTATVSPALPSIATSGGTVSGTWSVSLSGTVCGSNASQTVSGPVSGTVIAGGPTTLILIINNTGGGGGGGNNPLVLTGTATSLTGTLPGTSLLDDSATGNTTFAATGTSSANQTVYTGSGSGSGTVSCNGTPGTWTATFSAFTATVNPSVPSLATSGGSVSGTWSVNLALNACSQSLVNGPVGGTVAGTVSAGGATSLSLTCTTGCD